MDSSDFDFNSVPVPIRLEMLESGHESLSNAYFRQKKQLEEQEERIKQQERRIQSLEKLLGGTIHNVSDLILAFSKAGWGLPDTGQPAETAEKLQ